MTTEEVLRVINNSYIKSLSEFSGRIKKLLPEISNFVIFNIQHMGTSGSYAVARCYVGKDELIIKGFLYPTENWTEETHGYITAKKI